MEITLDNGRPGVLCCYQEDYHRRLDRPEGTWKRVAVLFASYRQSQRNHRGNIVEPRAKPRAKRAGGSQAVKQLSSQAVKQASWKCCGSQAMTNLTQ